MKRRMHNRNSTAGITLIELVVVIGIVAVVSAVMMFNYSSFSTNVSIRNLSQDIALAIRKAQSYATSVQALQSGSTTSYPAYGIAFSLANSSSNIAEPSQKRFILFADVNNNGVYDHDSTCGTPSVGKECVEGFGITTADMITALCEGDTSQNCVPQQSMTAMFCRPAPDASIYAGGGGMPNCGLEGTWMEVTVRSAKGLMQHVRLWNTGQISVQ